jgi:hypothetical protein
MLFSGNGKTNEKKTHKIFFDIFRTMNQSPTLRVFWRSKIQVEGNNYDYSQSESCLRTDLSWQIGLRDYIIQFSSIFDQLISVINDENRFQTYIRSLEMVENIFPIEYESLSVCFENKNLIKDCFCFV